MFSWSSLPPPPPPRPLPLLFDSDRRVSPTQSFLWLCYGAVALLSQTSECLLSLLVTPCIPAPDEVRFFTYLWWVSSHTSLSKQLTSLTAFHRLNLTSNIPHPALLLSPNDLRSFKSARIGVVRLLVLSGSNHTLTHSHTSDSFHCTQNTVVVNDT